MHSAGKAPALCMLKEIPMKLRVLAAFLFLILAVLVCTVLGRKKGAEGEPAVLPSADAEEALTEEAPTEEPDPETKQEESEAEDLNADMPEISDSSADDRESSEKTDDESASEVVDTYRIELEEDEEVEFK